MGPNCNMIYSDDKHKESVKGDITTHLSSGGLGCISGQTQRLFIHLFIFLDKLWTFSCDKRETAELCQLIRWHWPHRVSFWLWTNTETPTTHQLVRRRPRVETHLSPVMVSAGLASGGQAGTSFNICVQFGYEIWTYIHLLFFLIVCFVLCTLMSSLLVQNQDISVKTEYSAENLKRLWKCCNRGSNAGPCLV